jgi:photosystem II stability/assembly factor-like uncharacterized protein
LNHIHSVLTKHNIFELKSKKNMKALIAILFSILLSSTSFSQQGWFQQVVTTSNYFYSVFFVNSNTGWVVGQAGSVYKTTNGGTNWFTQTANAPGFLYSVFFIDFNTGWTAGQSGAIRKTTNSGVNWTPQVSGFSQNYLYSIIFTDLNTGYISGSTGLIIKTTNGGTNWQQQTSGVTNTLSCIYFPPSATSLTGFACGGSASEGVILKTSNGGLNWDPLTIGSNWLFGIFFADIQTGWAVGFNGTIYKTSNNGVNWSYQTSGTTNRLVAVNFPNSSTGYAVGFSGSIIKTTNAGNSWFAQQSNSTNNLWGTFFVDVNTGWAAGWNGTILHTTNGGVTYVSKISSEVPDEFVLYQNYPNPFNPSTTIKFDVPKGGKTQSWGFVKISIYDILGKEVKVLINEQIAPGTYEIQWDASAFSSGVYFYSLTAGDYIQTKSMILVK